MPKVARCGPPDRVGSASGIAVSAMEGPLGLAAFTTLLAMTTVELSPTPPSQASPYDEWKVNLPNCLTRGRTIWHTTPDVTQTSRSKPAPPIKRRRIISGLQRWLSAFFLNSSISGRSYMRSPVYRSWNDLSRPLRPQDGDTLHDVIIRVCRWYFDRLCMHECVQFLPYVALHLRFLAVLTPLDTPLYPSSYAYPPPSTR